MTLVQIVVEGGQIGKTETIFQTFILKTDTEALNEASGKSNWRSPSRANGLTISVSAKVGATTAFSGGIGPIVMSTYI